MTIPFTVLENGSVSTESDTTTQVAQRVNAIVSTEQGSRAMRAGMGLPLSQLLFQPADNVVSTQLASLVDKQLTTYEPGIKATSVTQNVSESGGGVASINVNYQPILQASQTSSVANMVTIEVGGTVTEVTLNGAS